MYHRCLERSGAKQKKGQHVLSFLMHSLLNCKHLYCKCKTNLNIYVFLLLSHATSWLSLHSEYVFFVWAQMQNSWTFFFFPNGPCVSTGRRRELRESIIESNNQSVSDDSTGSGLFKLLNVEELWENDRTNHIVMKNGASVTWAEGLWRRSTTNN